jgi:chemotaxis protein CheX
VQEELTVNVKFLNPFIDAVNEVMKAELQSDVLRGNLSLAKSALTTDDVTVLISLVGEIQGVVLYGMSIPTGLGMVSRIMGQEFTEFDNLAQSGVAELGNVITGRATIKFAEAGYQSTISPPTLVMGKGMQISTLDFPRIVVPLKTDFGEVIVHMALRESPPGNSDVEYVPITVKTGKK